MVMTKSETQAHRDSYHALIAKASYAQQQGLYTEVLANAVGSLEHIDGMMQYERKYEDRQFVSIDGIDLILVYAPLVLDFESLSRLGAVLKSQRRIERDTSADLSGRLAQAYEVMKCVHRLWDNLERNNVCQEDKLVAVLGETDDQWRRIVAASIELGFVRRRAGPPVRLSLRTRMDETVLGKCPACGVIGKSTKTKFLDEHHCPRCRSTVAFVILCNESDSEA